MRQEASLIEEEGGLAIVFRGREIFQPLVSHATHSWGKFWGTVVWNIVRFYLLKFYYLHFVIGRKGLGWSSIWNSGAFVRILERDNVRGMTIFRYTCSIHYVVRVEENFEVRSSGISCGFGIISILLFARGLWERIIVSQRISSLKSFKKDWRIEDVWGKFVPRNQIQWIFVWNFISESSAKWYCFLKRIETITRAFITHNFNL